MANNSSVILEIKRWLNQQHITVPTEWVQACVEFIQQEYNNKNLPLQSLKNYVYEQWLTADLEEIGVPSLPPDLQSVQKTCLSDVFTLQLNGIRDVGKPAFAQLRQLDGTTNADAEVSATPQPSQPLWESRPTRMLMLNLTDGISYVQGMEYKFIPFLSSDLRPGCKISIIGPVDCRLGLIMLTPDKIKILGGEVEKHLEKYSYKGMLKEALQIHVAENRVEPDNENEPEVQMGAVNAVNNASNFFAQCQPVHAVNENRNQQKSSRQLTNYPPKVQNRCSESLENEGDFTSCKQVLTGRKGQNQMINSEQYTNFSQKILNRQRNHPEYSSKDLNAAVNLDIDDFENEDDDFVQNLDYKTLDEIERKNSQKEPDPDEDIDPGLNEDEDMLQDVYAFQSNATSLGNQHTACINHNEPDPNASERMLPTAPFTILKNFIKQSDSSEEYSITIKGFISKVLSRLECTSNNGWNLTAKVSDGTGSIDVHFSDKVLEQFVGLSAKVMMAMQIQAGENVIIRNKMMEAVKSCKKKLQDLNCLMEIKFSGDSASVVKCTRTD